MFDCSVNSRGITFPVPKIGFTEIGPQRTVELALHGHSVRVQVSTSHRLITLNQCYNYYHPKPKYLIVGYMDPLGLMLEMHFPGVSWLF